MTREEIMQLNTDYLNDCESEHEMNEFFYYVLELLKREQEPCNDAISRQAVLDWLKRVTITDGITFETGFKQILYDIEQMPPVKPQEPKTGQFAEEDTGIKLDEAIERYTSNAEFERTHGNLQGCLEFRQLAKWLRELKMYRHYLLKEEIEQQGSEE